MQRLRHILLGTFMAASLVIVTPALASDPFFPAFGNAGIDVVHYDLDIDASSASRFDATATLEIRAIDPLTELSLDLHGLTVYAVKVAGKTAAFSQFNDKLQISLPRKTRRNARFRVVIAYGGTPEAIPDPTLPNDPSVTLGWKTNGDSAYVVSEPVGASTFFPANDQLDDPATFDISVTVPKPLIAAANGRLIRVRESAVSRRYDFSLKQPMTTWNATVQINEFKVSRLRSRGIPMRFYMTKTTPEATVVALKTAKDMVPYLEHRFGRYPYESYATVTNADPAHNYALETQTISQFPEKWGDSADSFIPVVAHELGHQWFGNAVSIKHWKDLWLAEGFATYIEVLWPRRNDPVAYRNAMLSIYDSVLKNNVGPAVVDAPEDLFGPRTYRRGVMALYAVELKIGQSRLQNIMRQWVKRNRNRTVTSDDFIRLAENFSRDKSVRSILEDWLYSPTVPTLPIVTSSNFRVQASINPVELVNDRRVTRH